MGVNSTEVSYGFGQMGSILHKSGGSVADAGISLNGELKQRGAAFVAITFLEDSTFTTGNSEGLVSEDNTLFPNSASGSTAIDTNGGSATDSVIFPAGVTIYGRWKSLKLDTGSCIAYIGY